MDEEEKRKGEQCKIDHPGCEAMMISAKNAKEKSPIWLQMISSADCSIGGSGRSMKLAASEYCRFRNKEKAFFSAADCPMADVKSWSLRNFPSILPLADWSVLDKLIRSFVFLAAIRRRAQSNELRVFLKMERADSSAILLRDLSECNQNGTLNLLAKARSNLWG